MNAFIGKIIKPYFINELCEDSSGGVQNNQVHKENVQKDKPEKKLLVIYVEHIRKKLTMHTINANYNIED